MQQNLKCHLKCHTTGDDADILNLKWQANFVSIKGVLKALMKPVLQFGLVEEKMISRNFLTISLQILLLFSDEISSQSQTLPCNGGAAVNLKAGSEFLMKSPNFPFFAFPSRT